jgi:hypothetical protein
MKIFSHGLRVATFAALVCAGAPAMAQPEKTPEKPAEKPVREPSPGDLMTARTALREGLALREKGDVAQAQARLQSAYDLVPTPVTGFELAKTHMLAGHVLTAHELFKKVERMPLSMEESSRSQTAREESARLAKELEPRIPSLRIKLKLVQGASAVIRIDDDPITTSGAETVRAVDPGDHELVAKAGDGPDQHVKVHVNEGETKDVELAPQWVPPKTPVTPDGKRVFYVKQTNPLAIVGFASASASAIWTGISFGVLQAQASELKDKCGEEFCPAQIRQEEGGPVLLWAVSTIAGGVGTIAFLAMGLIAANNPIREKVVAVSPTIGPGGAGLMGRF